MDTDAVVPDVTHAQPLLVLTYSDPCRHEVEGYRCLACTAGTPWVLLGSQSSVPRHQMPLDKFGIRLHRAAHELWVLGAIKLVFYVKIQSRGPWSYEYLAEST